VDGVSASSFAASIAADTGLSPEQVGMKAGMLVSGLFPILGTVLLLFTIRHFRKGSQT